jgi:hypothetical protein
MKIGVMENHGVSFSYKFFTSTHSGSKRKEYVRLVKLKDQIVNHDRMVETMLYEDAVLVIVEI